MNHYIFFNKKLACLITLGFFLQTSAMNWLPSREQLGQVIPSREAISAGLAQLRSRLPSPSSIVNLIPASVKDSFPGVEDWLIVASIATSLFLAMTLYGAQKYFVPALEETASVRSPEPTVATPPATDIPGQSQTPSIQRRASFPTLTPSSVATSLAPFSPVISTQAPSLASPTITASPTLPSATATPQPIPEESREALAEKKQEELTERVRRPYQPQTAEERARRATRTKRLEDINRELKLLHTKMYKGEQLTQEEEARRQTLINEMAALFPQRG